MHALPERVLAVGRHRHHPQWQGDRVHERRTPGSGAVGLHTAVQGQHRQHLLLRLRGVSVRRGIRHGVGARRRGLYAPHLQPPVQALRGGVHRPVPQGFRELRGVRRLRAPPDHPRQAPLDHDVSGGHAPHVEHLLGLRAGGGARHVRPVDRAAGERSQHGEGPRGRHPLQLLRGSTGRREHTAGVQRTRRCRDQAAARPPGGAQVGAAVGQGVRAGQHDRSPGGSGGQQHPARAAQEPHRLGAGARNPPRRDLHRLRRTVGTAVHEEEPAGRGRRHRRHAPQLPEHDQRLAVPAGEDADSPVQLDGVEAGAGGVREGRRWRRRGEGGGQGGQGGWQRWQRW